MKIAAKMHIPRKMVALLFRVVELPVQQTMTRLQLNLY